MADEKILVPNDRVFERGQGCWNCVNSDSAVAFWQDRRKQSVLRLKVLVDSTPAGAKNIQADNLARMIDTTDHSVAAHALLRCTKGITAEGKQVGDLVAHNYLCSKWSGKQGASLARRGKLDDLPEELADKLDGQPSDDLMNLIGKKLIDN
jgi:hypothetical protein